MKTIVIIFLFAAIAGAGLYAQSANFQDPLLEKMTGNWILKGTIDGKQTTHDVSVSWILDHQYIQLHEISREKKADGKPGYEALVLIGWDKQLNQYSCLWLDDTSGGGLKQNAFAHAERNEDKIAFIFKISDKSIFHTTFVYDRTNNTWQWIMDDEENGKIEPFARVTLAKEK